MRSADWEGVCFPGSSGGIVLRILLASSQRDRAPHATLKMFPVRGGPTFLLAYRRDTARSVLDKVHDRA
jgi:hypothetical protein